MMTDDELVEAVLSDAESIGSYSLSDAGSWSGNEGLVTITVSVVKIDGGDNQRLSVWHDNRCALTSLGEFMIVASVTSDGVLDPPVVISFMLTSDHQQVERSITLSRYCKQRRRGRVCVVKGTLIHIQVAFRHIPNRPRSALSPAPRSDVPLRRDSSIPQLVVSPSKSHRTEPCSHLDFDNMFCACLVS
eukprot:TRINITY_DN6952_c2_g1_i1.p1 TRINITY_DN6952_c2_g1~~TRINITY_DN6952_c2_g1_i1.p1  ORF type:complete len:189 (+),score=26.18 TRINITY_DN6952_c2_g1_i1:99-665(+)